MLCGLFLTSAYNICKINCKGGVILKELLIQIFGFIPAIVTLLSMHFDNRKKVLIMQCISTVLFLIYYFMIDASTGVIMNIISLVRIVVSSFNDRKWASHKAWLVIFLICYAVVSPLLGWDGPHSLLMVVAMILATIALWIHNLKVTRLLMAIVAPLLLLFDIFAGAWSPAIVDVLITISFLTALWRFDIRPKREKQKK